MVPPTAGLASVHTLGSGTSLLKRGRTLFHSGVAAGKSCQVGVGTTVNGVCRLGVSPVE